MSWKELAKKVAKAEAVGADSDLSGFTAGLQPVIEDATWGGESGPIEIALERGWTLIVTVDGGSGTSLYDDAQLSEVEVDLGTALSAVSDGKFKGRVTWDDLGADPLDHFDWMLDPDTGIDPSVEEDVPLQLRSPDGTVFVHGQTGGLDGQTARIELLSWEWASHSQQFELRVAIDLPGVANAPTGTHDIEENFSCYDSLDITLGGPDLEPLESMIDDAIEYLDKGIKAARKK